MRTPQVIVACVLAAAAIGCEPTAPANPSWQVDIMPIFAANCVRCHGSPAIGNAPAEFRLDTFESIQVGFLDDGDPMTPLEPQLALGAQVYGATAAARVDAPLAPMPPRFPLEPWQIETLKNWAPDPTEPPGRGEPRPGNQLPSLVVRELARDATSVTVAYSLHDPDGDLVAGQLNADDNQAIRFLAPIQSGSGELRLDLAGLNPPIEINAKLDDGAGFVDVDVLTLRAP